MTGPVVLGLALIIAGLAMTVIELVETRRPIPFVCQLGAYVTIGWLVWSMGGPA